MLKNLDFQIEISREFCGKDCINRALGPSRLFMCFCKNMEKDLGYFDMSYTQSQEEPVAAQLQSMPLSNTIAFPVNQRLS